MSDHYSNAQAGHAPYAPRADYKPEVTIIPKGYRNVVPSGQAPDVAFIGMENQPADVMQELQAHLVIPLCKGDYERFIAAFVIYGAYEDGQISFRLYLHDGRQLNSGPVLLDDQEHGINHPGEDVATQLYRRAQSMLGKAIPSDALERAKRDYGPRL